MSGLAIAAEFFPMNERDLDAVAALGLAHGASSHSTASDRATTDHVCLLT